MSSRRKKWLLGVAIAASGGLVTAFLVGRHLARRFEPYIKEQAVEYLKKRFDSEVELASLTVALPRLSPVKLVWSRGNGTIARVEGTGVLLRHKGRRDLPPMFAMKAFHFEVDLGRVFDKVKHIDVVSLDGMEIHIPPKGERPGLKDPEPGPPPDVVIADVFIRDAKLVLLPRQKDRKPLEFRLHDVHLESAGLNRAMNYTARLTNPRPPGEIESKGTFGPWDAGTPSETPLGGQYTFTQADLGVFPAIAGILNSTGQFQGRLSSIEAKGRATVPDFRLRRSGNRVPLQADFDALIDGTNGNTTLQPVRVVLGSTRFTTSGAVIKHEVEQRRSIGLTVAMPNGNLGDILRLAMPGQPMMTGRLELNSRIEIPPLSGKVIDKLLLDGKFQIRDGKFLKSKIQEKLDMLSRRGQGQPKNVEIDEVDSVMGGEFHLDDKVITFRQLRFGVPGADVELAGSYDLDKDQLDFHGALKLAAKVSQTMSGWKRIALKPVDPFFSKNGAGTFVRIQVTGSSKDPDFGRERGPKEKK